MNGDQHAAKLRADGGSAFASQSQAAKGSIVVGEWSASLDPRGLGNAPDGEKDRQRREFVRAELDLFESHAGGWWFWTLKKGQGWDAGWSAKDAARAEILPAWVGSQKFHGPPSAETKQQQQHEKHEAHKSYWASHGGSPNPQVYGPGFSQGWDDALIFLGASDGPSELGFVSQWTRRRMSEYEASNEKLGKAAWEWEHGFQEGVLSCNLASLG